jgi:hypothetical protein
VVGSGPPLQRELWGLAIDSGGAIWASTADYGVYRIDPTTGNRVLISCGGPTSSCINGTAGNGPAVANPEIGIFPTQPAQVSGLGSWAAPLLLGILIGLTVRVMRKGAVEAAAEAGS